MKNSISTMTERRAAAKLIVRNARAERARQDLARRSVVPDIEPYLSAIVGDVQKEVVASLLEGDTTEEIALARGTSYTAVHYARQSACNRMRRAAHDASFEKYIGLVQHGGES